MNRIARRSAIVLILVLALAVGLVFFFGEYLAKSESWITFSGSPHIYDDTGKVACGTVTGRNGTMLLDLSQGRRYTSDGALRQAMLHWVGDRQGNIAVPYLKTYSKALVGFDLTDGIYAYGSTQGNIRLTLSADVQKVALEAMGSHKGTVAVYNYKTGELLCAVTTPNFDPESVPDLSSDAEGTYEGVYWNRFLQSKYIPGSIFKIVTLAAALETMPELTQEKFTCSAVYEMVGGDVTCERSHGTQSLKEAFCNSCNCVFAQLAQRVGADKLSGFVKYAGVTDAISFDGYTTTTGNFDLQGASEEQMAWSAIGQHKDQVNPCAFLNFIGAIAADGVGVQPYLVEEVSVGQKETYRASVQKNERIISKNTAGLLQEYMRNNVVMKYGQENFPDLVICAKSGTGEVGGDRKPNAMFAGFVSDVDYPLAFLVAVEDGGYGSQVCIPIVNAVLNACLLEMNGQ